MTDLTALRQRREGERFRRLDRDDHRTALSPAKTRSLERALRDKLRGEVRFDDGARALYATDASNYRQVPIGVVIPRDIDDVVHTVAAAREHGAPVLSRGGGTSLAGQCCNVAVVMDFSKYLHNVIEIDPDRQLARVEPGCILDDLRDAARRYGLTFAPDPATHNRNTLGGMLGNNSCGIHSLLARKHGRGLRTSDNTHALSVLTYDGLGLHVGETPESELERLAAGGGRRGEIYRGLKRLRDQYGDRIRSGFPKLPRRVSGYNLDDLLPENRCNVARSLVGTESTCVTILEAELHLVPEPGARSLLVLGYPDVYETGRHLTNILDLDPTGLEGMDELLFQWIRRTGDLRANLDLLPEGGGWLLVEFGGENKDDSDDQAHRCMEMLRRESGTPSMKLFDNPDEEQMIWAVREDGLAATAWVPGHADTWPGFEDSAVPPESVGDYLHDLRDLMHRYGFDPSLYGHFGQGCIHCRIGFDLYSSPGIRKFERFLDEATDLVASYGGSISGEHGDGQAKAEFLGKMFGPELVQAFGEFKALWDPDGKMNPGKVVDPYLSDTNLRLGPDYNPPQPETWFRYPNDEHSFSRAALRCVSVGVCRREGGGVMCPSYMVTREEKFTTRGRAHLLFEMLNGEVMTDGWRSEPVKEALDLCLACKGCKKDCPVNVDMATYKAEFLAHYYAGRLRPRNAYAFGWLPIWARLMQKVPLAPTLANLVTQTPVLRSAARWAAGMSQERRVPRFAPRSFTDWVRTRPPQNPTGRPVVLWPDTFNNYLHPGTARAAFDVLESAGFRVLVPDGHLCCGRPLYDYGFLGMARRWLENIMDEMRPVIQAGIPIVMLEPSCAAVFRDELLNLFPTEHDAQRLSEQTKLFSEFLVEDAADYKLPQLRRDALVHGHCHHKSIMGMSAEDEILHSLGIDFTAPEDGCCGMAGAFGFESGDRYDVSIAAGERVLLPRVREADRDTLIIADGFSCREQISQTTSRRALHLAEVVDLARRTGPAGPRRGPEAELVAQRRRSHRTAVLKTAGVAAGLAVAGAGALRLVDSLNH